MRRHFRGLRHPANGAGVALVVLLAAGGCASSSSGKIGLDDLVARAREAAAATMDPADPFERGRVAISTETDEPTVNRCLFSGYLEPRSQKYRKLTLHAKERIAGRKFYVVRFSIPTGYVRDDGELMLYEGWEPCVFIDRDTGEVLVVTAPWWKSGLAIRLGGAQ